MRTLVVSSRKGGAGKTTLTGHLGVMAEQTGFGPVALIDTDEQGSLASWWNERQAATPGFAQVEIPKLKAHLQALEQAGVKLAVIDTPPGMTRDVKLILEAVLPLADLVLIPTRPSPHDLRAVGATVELVEKAGKKMVFVVNGAANRAKITSDAAIALSQYGTVAPVTVFQRTDFAASMIDGRTVQEIDPTSKSASEIIALWKYVSKQMKM